MQERKAGLRPQQAPESGRFCGKLAREALQGEKVEN